MSSNLEAAIELASSLKNEAERLYRAYDALPAALAVEKRAIEAADFGAVEAAGKMKADLADEVELAFNAIRAYADRLGRRQTLSQCVVALEEILVGVPQSLAADVLRHQIQGLARLTAQFDERSKTVKPEIERNKVLLETMLAAYQESYRFWVSVSEETASNYDQRGVQASKGRNHGFRARA